MNPTYITDEQIDELLHTLAHCSTAAARRIAVRNVLSHPAPQHTAPAVMQLAAPAGPRYHREWRFACQEALDTMEAEIESREDQENVRRMKRATLVLQSMLAAVPLPPAAAPAVPWPIAPDVADELERSDWTPEEALRWYAAGRHYDTVPNADGTSSARILDNGEVATNALRAYDDQALTGEAPGRHLAEHILGMDFVTDRGLRARELARKVLSQDDAALAAPTSEQAVTRIAAALARRPAAEGSAT